MTFTNYAQIKQQNHSSKSSRGTRTTKPRKTQKRADCKSKPETRIVLKLKYKDGEVRYAEETSPPPDQLLAKSDGSDANPALDCRTALTDPADRIRPEDGPTGTVHNPLPQPAELPEDGGQPEVHPSVSERSRCIGKKKRSRIKKENVRKGSARILANRRGEEESEAKPLTRSSSNGAVLDQIKHESLPMSRNRGGAKQEGTEPSEEPEERAGPNRKKQKVAKVEQQKCQYSAEEIEHWFSDDNLRRLGLYIDPMYPAKSELVCYEMKPEEQEWSYGINYGINYGDLQLLNVHSPREMYPQEEGDWSQLTRNESNRDIGSFENFNELFKKHVDCGNAEKQEGQEKQEAERTGLEPMDCANNLSSINSEGLVNTYSNNLMMMNQMPGYRLPQLQNYFVLQDRCGQDWGTEEDQVLFEPGVSKDRYSADPTMESGQSYFAPSVLAGLLPCNSFYFDPTDHGHPTGGLQNSMYQN